ncbi:MAG TPA: phosphoribosylformylglycinamidine synthase subunit PurQ [Candidatus Dormibacteraeota bacterium]|jgi:phosphoribosylformylglycinamidine synthase|nr:phosphoribosylformylglycinamidine synthase subunit PurQ [Candidatus Dormibacteraeota bacterium]
MASFGIVVFPGTWSDRDCMYAVRDRLKHEARFIWHKERDLSGLDCVILPGGFSYGDHLRTGAVARFSPVMASVVDFAQRGGYVIGICNGFQILCEAHLLPGALMRNDSLQFRCLGDALLRVESTASAFTSELGVGQVLNIPVSHGEGNYHADADTLGRLEATGRVAFRYCDAGGRVTTAANPNGSLNNIAGILNEPGNVLGMMPHPERTVEDLLGGEDGLRIFRSIARNAERVFAG